MNSNSLQNECQFAASKSLRSKRRKLLYRKQAVNKWDLRPWRRIGWSNRTVLNKPIDVGSGASDRKLGMWGVCVWRDWTKKKKLMDHRVGIAGGGGRGSGGGHGGISSDGRRLDLGWRMHNTLCRWCVVELCPWNLCNFVNQCYPNTFNKKEKIK